METQHTIVFKFYTTTHRHKMDTTGSEITTTTLPTRSTATCADTLSVEMGFG
jgi:hypothetical protein